MGSLDGKVAIVTGASKGLGLVVARTLFDSGASVAMAARSTSQLAKAAVSIDSDAQLRTDRIYAVRCDVRIAQDVDTMVTRVLEQFGRVDLLICNAGIYGPIGMTENSDTDAWIDAINTNLIGTFLCCRYVLPHMRHQRYGKIVTLSGGGATTALPNYSAYSASKTGIVRFTETLAEELLATQANIFVNAVAPGALNTDMLQEAIDAGEENNGVVNWMRVKAQQKHGGESLQNAADLITYLCEPASDGLSGRLFSAVWDNWKSEALLNKLELDTFKLRRQL